MEELGQNLLRVLLVGLVNGTLYGVIGLGIVLIFKSQRIVNFAQAEFATFGAFILYVLTSLAGLTYLLAAPIAVTATVALAIVVERVVIRPLRGSPDVTVFVATAGVALLIIGLTFVVAGANIVIVEPLLPAVEEEFRGRGLIGLVSPQRLLVLAVLVTASAGLTVFFRTLLGRGVLAMSDEPFAVRLAGISPERMSILIWGIAGLLAGLAGVAYIPTSRLIPGVFTSDALIPALTAVVIGGLTSLPGALVGGLAIGFVAELAAVYAPPGLPGPAIVASFVILLLTLLLRPRGLLVKEAAT